MYIKKVRVSNFRIYYDTSSITFKPSGDRNITIISGDNGRGKTTFLTALVWCLYGKQMQDVDNSYKEQIAKHDGYYKYLLSSLNQRARLEGCKEYHVSICFQDVTLPGSSSNSIEITRSFNINEKSDSLEINIDGTFNELVEDVGQQIFIQDFILPKEIARFFFFDAEKIVELAEISSIQEKRALSQAYSEVLGIKKYEELRNNLHNLRIKFRKESANSDEKEAFFKLGKETQRLNKSIKNMELKIDKLIKEKTVLRYQADKIYEQLLRAGSTLTIEDVNNLQEQKTKLKEKEKELILEFKELLEYAPFAIMGKVLLCIKEQLDNEEKNKKALTTKDVVEEKIASIINELKNDMNRVSLWVNNEFKNYYIGKVRELLSEHFLPSYQDSKNNEIKVLHDFSSEHKNSFDTLLHSLKTTYKYRLNEVVRQLKNIKIDYSQINKRLAPAEAEVADTLTNEYKLNRVETENKIQRIEDKMLNLSKTMGSFSNELQSKIQLYDELADKIKINEKYKDKDALTTRLISRLDEFIKKFKEAKKLSLEQKILTNLNLLMHKKGFVHQVTIDIGSDITEIRLQDIHGYEVRKEDLSKGEQQLYATAVLKSLIGESFMEFPIFIDSPLQKFDDKHARNIITSFYPNVSKQVVLFPLPNTEFGLKEYELLIDYIDATYLINGRFENASTIELIEADRLFVVDQKKLFIAEHV